jgi:hypothetical protein
MVCCAADFPISRARGIVFNIVGGEDMTLQEINSAAEVIYENVDPDANIIFGALVDDKILNGEVSITVLATGFSTDFFDYSEVIDEPIATPAVVPVKPVTKATKTDVSSILNTSRPPVKRQAIPAPTSSANDWRKAKREDVARDQFRDTDRKQPIRIPVKSYDEEDAEDYARGSRRTPVDADDDEDADSDDGGRRGRRQDAREDDRGRRSSSRTEKPKKKYRGIRGFFQKVLGRFF